MKYNSLNNYILKESIMTLLERKLDHLNIAVPDLKEAVEFYTKTLGFKEKERYSNGTREFVFLTDGNITYELIENKALDSAVFEHIAYVSEDIEADFNYYKNLDSNLLLSPKVGYADFLFENGVKFFFIQGAGGERIEFCQR